MSKNVNTTNTLYTNIYYIRMQEENNKETQIVTCCICGKQEDVSHYCDEYREDLVSHQMCHTCAHWRMNHELDSDTHKRGPHKYAIINGKHFVLGGGSSFFKGCGGAKFKIKFNDGTVKECSDLWHQGNILEAHPHWRELMPDNAVFIKEEGYQWCS